MFLKTRIFLKNNYLLLIVIVIASVLRFTHLGYSDYQGDEIKALFMPGSDETATEFLLDQRKGPVQFLITMIVSFINPGYDNQLLTRLPFAIASFLAVILFYKFVEIIFGKKVAFFASFFFATNGFLVAFARIVQYQSFILFFEFLALYLLSLAAYKPNNKYNVVFIYLGLSAWAMSILSHYNGIFIAPFAFYFLYKWFKTASYNYKFKLFNFILAGSVSAGLLLAFYVPFVFSIKDATLAYWSNRVSGGDGKVSSSYYLFTVYQPIYVIHMYVGLFVLGLLTFIKRNFFSHIEKFLVILWGLLPLIFLELVINLPGTHIFNYLVPGMIMMGFGVNFIHEVLGRVLRQKILCNFVFSIGVFTVFTFIALQSYFIFVDHKSEYPWENEKFFVWNFSKPSASYHLSLFGFPYSREWEEVRNFIKLQSASSFYTTNERDSIVRYYVPLVKSGENIGYYIYVLNPQSFTDKILNERAKAWVDENEPVNIIKKEGKELVKIYYLPPNFQPLSAK